MLSVVSASDHRLLSIEVKASTVSGDGEFHLTANEWRRALEADAHLFHLWSLDRDDEPKLIVISTDKLASHVPINQGEGAWENASIPFSAFRP